MAVRLLLERQLKGEPNPEPATIPARPPRATYKQDWPNYNLAQTNEKDHFQELLADLCRGIKMPSPNPKGGRTPMPIDDAVFSAVLKVYALVSARRFMSDLREAHHAATSARCCATTAFSTVWKWRKRRRSSWP